MGIRHARWGAAVSALAAAATFPAVGGAAIAPGTFKGTSSANDPLGFRVNQQGRVQGFYYEGVTLTCTDGDRLDSPTGRARVVTPARTTFRITPANTFGIAARNPRTGFAWNATGRFTTMGRRATGRLYLTARFNQRNEQDPNGTVRCQSRRLTWSAARQVARR